MVSVSPSNLDMKKLVIDSSFACGSSSINIVTASTLQRAGRIKSSPRPRDAGGKRRGPMVRSQGSGMLHRWRGTVMGERCGNETWRFMVVGFCIELPRSDPLEENIPRYIIDWLLNQKGNCWKCNFDPSTRHQPTQHDCWRSTPSLFFCLL